MCAYYIFIHKVWTPARLSYADCVAARDRHDGITRGLFQVRKTHIKRFVHLLVEQKVDIHRPTSLF